MNRRTCRVCTRDLPAWVSSKNPYCTDGCRTDWAELRGKVWARDGGWCAICGQHVGTRFEVDHIVPLHLGGKTELGNLQTLCSPCHRAKSATKTTARAQAKRRGAAQGKVVDLENLRVKRELGSIGV